VPLKIGVELQSKSMKNIYKAAILLIAIVLSWLTFNWMAPRFSRFYFSLIALPTIPLVIWRPKVLRLMLTAVFLINLLLTIPVDLVFRRGDRFAVDILPVSFGFFENPGTVGYGCVIWENPPKYAVVVRY
jgi:hypothetical protein